MFTATDSQAKRELRLPLTRLSQRAARLRTVREAADIRFYPPFGVFMCVCVLFAHGYHSFGLHRCCNISLVRDATIHFCRLSAGAQGINYDLFKLFARTLNTARTRTTTTTCSNEQEGFSRLFLYFVCYFRTFFTIIAVYVSFFGAIML